MKEKDILPLPDGSPFETTRNWFRGRNLPTFREYVFPEWHDKPANILEIGVFEGACLVWMLQYLHPESRYWGMDPWLPTTKLDGDFMDAVRGRAYRNTEHWRDRCTLMRMNSAEALSRASVRGYEGLKKGCLDIALIDGDHTDLAAWADARKCLPLLRSGGWLLFDDVENRITKPHHVKQGVAMFLAENPDAVKLIWKDRFMECYQKQ